jgi:hypothetical protein
MENEITRYVSRYEPIASDGGTAKKIKARVKEIVDTVEVRAQDAVKLDQTQEDSYKEIGHAFVKSRETTQNNMIHETECHVKFTPAEGNAKPDVNYLIDVDKNVTSGDGKLVDGTGYTKSKSETTSVGLPSMEKIHYGISECDPEAGTHTKEEVDISVKGPGIQYSIKDMNDPNFKEEVFFLSKDDVGL